MQHRSEDPAVLQRALKVLWQSYQAPLLKLLGGEPLLHPAIDKIISVAKSGTGARLRLVTNGTLLQRRYKMLQGVDEVHISAYPGTLIPNDEMLCRIAADLDAPITVEAFGQFRWHRSPMRTDSRITEQIFATCQMYHSWQCHTLRGGWLYPCPPAGTWGSDHSEAINLLEGTPELGQQIERLLSRRTPLQTCSECLGSVGHPFKHRLGWRSRHDQLQEQTVDAVFLQVLQSDADANNQCFQYLRTICPTGHVQVH